MGEKPISNLKNKEVPMAPGSIVERTMELEEGDPSRTNGSIIPPMKTPFVVKNGPRPAVGVRVLNGIRLVFTVDLIEPEEYPGEEYNVIFFSELIPPQEVSIEEIIADCEPAYA